MEERRELQREKAWSRIFLTPILQAEADRDNVRRRLATQAREKEIMKEVPGWNEKQPIYSGRFGEPTFVVLPSTK